jgi:hypothetical protein
MSLPRVIRPAAVVAACGLLAVILPGAPATASNETVVVDLSTTLGAPQYRASGTLHGMTEDGANPPDHFYRDIKWHFERAGGAHLDTPGGWVAGKFARRWKSTLAQAKRTAALGGTFIILPHDLWGVDGSPGMRFPGDNGDWTDFDAFLDTVLSDVRSNGLTVEWDIWNEPDLNGFWARPQSQYLAMWAHAYRRIRAALPGAVIVGPSTAGKPSAGSAWWTAFLNYAKSNNVLPTIYSWHDEPGDPVTEKRAADALLSAHGIANSRPYQINEYGTYGQQNAGYGGWLISRLERAGADGLRGNWASGLNEQDFAANLLVKNAAGQYQPRGEWWMYQFYGGMTGSLVANHAEQRHRGRGHQNHRHGQDPARQPGQHRHDDRRPQPLGRRPGSGQRRTGTGDRAACAGQQRRCRDRPGHRVRQHRQRQRKLRGRAGAVDQRP